MFREKSMDSFGGVSKIYSQKAPTWFLGVHSQRQRLINSSILEAFNKKANSLWKRVCLFQNIPVTHVGQNRLEHRV